MTLLIMPTYSCNLSCAYCFESALGLQAKPKLEYDLTRMLESILKIQKLCPHREAVLHGGEPLLMPLKDLRKLIVFLKHLGLEVRIQSNCTLITDEHIELFKQYNVLVGCSVDGSPELNILRGYWYKGKMDRERTMEYCKKVQENLERLADAKVLSGVLVILHRANAGDEEKLRKLAEWIDWLSTLGVTGGRLNPMYAVTPWSKPYELSIDELYRAYVWLWENFFEKRPDLRWSPYYDITAVLMGREDIALCWFNGCCFYDSFVWTVGCKGEILSCDRTFSCGLWCRARPLPRTEMIIKKVRALALLQTELRDSRYGHLHKGGCPAEGIEGDWRRPSRFWKLWEKMFEYFERKIKAMFPWMKLASEVPDKFEYIEMVSRGCRWNPIEGRYICPESSR